jgi:ribonuclease HI
MRPKEEKKVAHSYLSLVNGVVERHADWKSCEARVKGRSGAKFKKSASAENESEILAEWGVSYPRK